MTDSGTFAIYCRASEENGDGFSSDPEEQEAEARAWAAKAGLDVELEPVFEVVSGSLAADDRMLGQLIDRCEAGELGGVIVRDIFRFARDSIAGATALARIHRCGARLIATRNGVDTENITPDQNQMIQMMLSTGEAELRRNRLRRTRGKRNAAERGVYCALPPVGYDRDADGKLVPNEDTDAVRQIFRLRAEGRGFSDIARAIPEVSMIVGGGHGNKGVKATRTRTHLSRSAMRKVVTSRVYLGEQVVPTTDSLGNRTEPVKIADSHPPLVTSTEWEAANAVKGHGPRHTGLGAEVAGLRGLVLCGSCGGKLHVNNPRAPRYFCVAGPGHCECRASFDVLKLDGAIDTALTEAFRNEVPEVLAVAEGSDRYERALDAVERAAATLAEYRDNTDLQKLLGMADFAAGLRVRKEAYELAQRSLREQGPAPSKKGATDVRKIVRESARQFVAEVTVFPRNVDPRVTVRWHGAETAVPVPVQPRSRIAA